MVFTPADFIILTNQRPDDPGMAEVVNQILPGLTSRIVVDAAEFPTTGKWYFSRMPTMEEERNGVPQGARRNQPYRS